MYNLRSTTKHMIQWIQKCEHVKGILEAKIQTRLSVAWYLHFLSWFLIRKVNWLETEHKVRLLRDFTRELPRQKTKS
jgi:hypothetical protein